MLYIGLDSEFSNFCVLELYALFLIFNSISRPIVCDGDTVPTCFPRAEEGGWTLVEPASGGGPEGVCVV
jgi:hypothetical protein